MQLEIRRLSWAQIATTPSGTERYSAGYLGPLGSTSSLWL